MRTRTSVKVMMAATVLTVVATQAPAVASSTVTVNGQFSKKVGKVLVLVTNGTTYFATPSASGKVSVKVPAKNLANATVQMVDPTGKYLGPVVLNVKKTGSKYKAITGLKAKSSGSVSLGKIAMKTGYAISAVKSAGGNAGVTSDKNGKTKGAGNGGRVKSGGFAPVAVASVVHKLAAARCPDGTTRDTAVSGVDPGRDLDCDGVPNVLDVDDNGNGSLDIMDQATNNTSDKNNYTASMSTYSGVRGSMSDKLNIHASDSATLLSAVKKILASDGQQGTSSFSIAMYISERTFTKGTGTSPDAVYVECPGIKWCDALNSGASAQLQSFTEIAPVIGYTTRPWKTTASTDLSSGKEVPNSSYVSNGMYRFSDSGGEKRWAAFVAPSYQGDDVLSVVRPADVMLIHVIQGNVDTVFTVNVSPFLLTTPYLASATATGVTTNTASNLASGSVVVGTDGKLSISFYRPQRLLLEGETGESVNSSFKSQHGLHYGLGGEMYYVNGRSGRTQALVGCGGADAATNYTGLGANMKAETSAYGEDILASDFWPVLDDTPDTSADDGTLTLTWDMKNCLTNHTPAYFGRWNYSALSGKKVQDALGFTWAEFAADPNAYFDATLTAVGAPSTNGYNSATLRLLVRSPAWTGQSQGGGGGGGTGGGSTESVSLRIVRSSGDFNVGGITTGCSFGGVGASCEVSVANGSSVFFESKDNTQTVSVASGSTAGSDNSTNGCTVSSGGLKLTCVIDKTKGAPQTWNIDVK
jgi:hypothetical protein